MCFICDQESSSSDEESEESDEDDDNDFPPGYKDKKAFVKSLRADAIVSSGLNLSRKWVTLIFKMFMINLNTVPAPCPRQFSYLDFLVRTVGKQLVVRDTTY